MGKIWEEGKMLGNGRGRLRKVGRRGRLGKEGGRKGSGKGA
jgi:hypothetical protein